MLLIALVTVSFFNSCTSNQEEKIKKQSSSLESYLVKKDFIKLSLKKMPSGHLHLFGKLNGVKGNFILDTGAGTTVIEEKNKDKFHMKSKNSEERATGAGGTGIRLQTSEKNNFKIGELTLNNIDLMLMNLDHVNNAFDSMGIEKVDGIIGSDILTRNKAIIDYSNLVVYLKP